MVHSKFRITKELRSSGKTCRSTTSGKKFPEAEVYHPYADMAPEWQESTAFRVRATNLEEIFMSTSAVSSSSLYQQLQSYFQTRNSDVQQLGQALQQGNLSAAQTAFNNIQSLGQNGPFANGDAFRSSQREQDFDAIGQALQNGDLAGAQSAFASLQSTFNQNPVNSGGPAQGVSTPAGSGPEIILNLSNAGGEAATPEQITINIGQAGGGAEQVSLSVGPEGSSNPTQFEFNLNPNSNEQIVLNLLGPATTGGTASTTGSSAGGGANGGLSVSA
jgi:hypothetical protein